MCKIIFNLGGVKIKRRMWFDSYAKCNKILPLSKFFYINTRKKESALCKKCHNRRN